MTGRPLATAITKASDLDLDRVPDDVLAHTGRVVADTVGVVVAGARSPEVVNLAAAHGVGVSATSSVLTSPMHRLAAVDAAFINATAGTFLELDEGMRPTGHPAMHVLPAAMAVAEREHSTGEELLRAFLAGYEVTSRLFRAFRLRYPVHPHGHFGAVGAAVACAILENAEPVDAGLIAATTPLLPVWDACYDGATARNTYTGLAAQSGVRSCMLARAGFTGTENALRAAFAEIAGELVDESALTVDVDYSDLGITRNYFKRHSACALSHAAIDAVLELEIPPGVRVDGVQVETVANNIKLARQPLANDLSGRFSLPYAVATVAILGRADVEAFGFRTDVAELAKRVEVRMAPDLEAKWPDSSPARVTVRTEDRTFSGTAENPRGHHTNPLTENEVRSKFVKLVGNPDGERLWPQLNSLTAVSDCRELFAETDK